MAWILPFKEAGDADGKNLYIAYNQLAIQIGKYVDFFNTWHNDVIDPSNNTEGAETGIITCDDDGTNCSRFDDDYIGKKLYPRFDADPPFKNSVWPQGCNPGDEGCTVTEAAADKLLAWKKKLPWDLYGDEDPRTFASAGDANTSLPLRRYLGPEGLTYATNPAVDSMTPLDDFYNKTEKPKNWILRPRPADGMRSVAQGGGSFVDQPYRAMFLKVSPVDVSLGNTHMQTIQWPEVGFGILDSWTDKRISTQNYKDEYFDATILGLGEDVHQGRWFSSPDLAGGSYVFGNWASMPYYYATSASTEPGFDAKRAGGQPYPYGWINPGWLSLQVTLINLFGGKRGIEIPQNGNLPSDTDGFTIGVDGTLLAPLDYDGFTTSTPQFAGGPPNGDGAPFAAMNGFGEWNDGYFELRKKANYYLDEEGVSEGLFYVGDADDVAKYHEKYDRKYAINGGQGSAPFSCSKKYPWMMGFLGCEGQDSRFLQPMHLVNQMWAICMVFEQEAAYLNVGMGAPDPSLVCCEGGLPVPGQDPMPTEFFCEGPPVKADGCYPDPDLPYVQPDPPNVALKNTVEGSVYQVTTHGDAPWDEDGETCEEWRDSICKALDLKSGADVDGFDGAVDEDPDATQDSGHAEVSDGGVRDQFDNQLESNPLSFGTVREGITLTIQKTCDPNDPTNPATEYVPKSTSVTQTQTLFQYFARFVGCCDDLDSQKPGDGTDLIIFRHVVGGEGDDRYYFNPLHDGTGNLLIASVIDADVGDIVTVEEFKNNTEDTIEFKEFPHAVNYNGDTELVGIDGEHVGPDGELVPNPVDASETPMTIRKQCVGGLPRFPCTVDGVPVPDDPPTYYYVLKGSENCILNQQVFITKDDGTVINADNGGTTLSCANLDVIEELKDDLDCGETITLEIYFDPYVLGRKAHGSAALPYGVPATDGRGISTSWA